MFFVAEREKVLPLFLFRIDKQAGPSSPRMANFIARLTPAMKPSILLLFVSLLVIQPLRAREPKPKAADRLAVLLAQKDYFGLKENYEQQRAGLTPAYDYYFGAMVAGFFNQPKQSEQYIDSLLQLQPQPLQISELKQLYGLKLQNHIALFDYAEAAKTSRFLVSTYRNQLDSAEVAEYENSGKIWEALAGTEPQQLARDGDFNGQLSRDKVGLFRIATIIGGQSRNFVFDTGANFSVVQRTVANELGLKIIPSDFLVTAATGQKVRSQLAVASEICFGGLRFRHVVFLVFDDADLSFPQLDYQIEGIIGFPVINAMDEIRITKDNHLFVPQTPGLYANANFALDGLTPVVAVDCKGDRLRFHFDTGATTTILYPAFYTKYQPEIDRKYRRETFTAGSAGGQTSFDGFYIEKLNVGVGGSTARLKHLRLQLDETGIGKSLHGNLGQDFIKQFNQMIISFKQSSILFR